MGQLLYPSYRNHPYGSLLRKPCHVNPLQQDKRQQAQVAGRTIPVGSVRKLLTAGVVRQGSRLLYLLVPVSLPAVTSIADFEYSSRGGSEQSGSGLKLALLQAEVWPETSGGPFQPELLRAHLAACSECAAHYRNACFRQWLQPLSKGKYM